MIYNRFKLTLKCTIVLLLAMFSSCVQNEWDIAPKGEGKKKARLTLQTNLGSFITPTTRAGVANETDVDLTNINAVISVLDEPSNKYVIKEVLSQVTAQYNTTSGLYEITLEAEETDVSTNILLVANVSSFQLATGAVAAINDFSAFVSGTTYLSDLQSKMHTIQLVAAGTPFPYPAPAATTATQRIPMSGSNVLADGITAGGQSLYIPLKRIVAKITVTDANTADLFSLRGVSIDNAPTRGRIIAPTNWEDLNQYRKYTVAADRINYPDNAALAPSPYTTTAANPLYIYESDPTHGTTLIVYGLYDGAPTWYKLTMDKDYNNATGGIGKNLYRRNHIYDFKLINVKGPGYSSLSAARAGAPNNNLIAQVSVTDLSSHDIIGSDDTYLGLSNSEYIYYGDIGISSQGLDIAEIACSNGATPIAVAGNTTKISSVTVTPNAGRGTWTLKATLTGPFNGMTDEYINVTAGKLSKKIKITKREGLDNNQAGVIDDFTKDGDCVVGIMENPATSWVSLSESPTIPYNSGSKEIYTDLGKFYILFNSSLHNINPFFADLYISRNNSKGRAKVHLGLKDIRFQSTDMPELFYLNSADQPATYTFNFSNEGGFDFETKLIAFTDFGAGTTTEQVLSSSTSADIARTGIATPMAVAGEGAIFTYYTLRIEYRGNTYDIPIARQSSVEIVRILTVGGSTFSDWGGTTIALDGSTTTPLSTYSNGLGPLLNYAFGKSKGSGRSIAYQFYSIHKPIYNNSVSNRTLRYQNIIEILREYKIHILMCLSGTSDVESDNPSSAQVSSILNWLDGSDTGSSLDLDPAKAKHRGLVINSDWENGGGTGIRNNEEFYQQLFETKPNYYGTKSGPMFTPQNSGDDAAIYSDPVFQQIMLTQGGLSGGKNLTADGTFNGQTATYTSIPRSNKHFDRNQVLAKELFIPLMYNRTGTAPNQVDNAIVSVNPARRILSIGELQFWGATNTNANYLPLSPQSLSRTTNGEFPLFWVGVFDWYMRLVAIGGSN